MGTLKCIVIGSKGFVDVLGERGYPSKWFPGSEDAIEWLRVHGTTVQGALIEFDVGQESQEIVRRLSEIRGAAPDIAVLVLLSSADALTPDDREAIRDPKVIVANKPFADWATFTRRLGDPVRPRRKWNVPLTVTISIIGLIVAIAGFANNVYPIHRLWDPRGLASVTVSENPIPLSALTILASKRFLFQGNGLDVKPVRFRSGREALDALLGGSAQFATVAETPVTLANLQGQKIVVIATIGESAEECKLVVRSDVIKSVSDLKGKKVATFIGTNAEYFLDTLLRENGLDPKDVQIVSMPPPEMVASFSRGDVVGYAVWQPFVYSGIKLAQDPKFANLAPHAYTVRDKYVMTFNIVTTRDFLVSAPAVVHGFLKSLDDAKRDLEQRPAEAQQTIADETGLELSELQVLWPNYRFGPFLDADLIEFLRQQVAWARSNANYAISRTVDVRDMIAPEALAELRPELVRIH